MARILLPLLATVAGYWALAWVLQRVMLYPARTAPPAVPSLHAAGGEQVWLEVDGHRVEAWWLPAPHPGTAPATLLVFAHGNGELIDDWLPAFETPRRWGASVLLVEYPGYGRSGGRPGEGSITRAMTAAWDWAVSRGLAAPDRVVSWGRSVGGGAAAALARERPVAALVLESSFTSVGRLARRRGVPDFLIRDRFDNLAVLRRYEGPVLVIHGEHDPLVPPSHARALQRAARNAELHLLPCGHNDCPRPWGLVREFLVTRGLL